MTNGQTHIGGGVENVTNGRTHRGKKGDVTTIQHTYGKLFSMVGCCIDSLPIFAGCVKFPTFLRCGLDLGDSKQQGAISRRHMLLHHWLENLQDLDERLPSHEIVGINSTSIYV